MWVKSSYSQSTDCLQWRTSSYSMSNGDCVETAPAVLPGALVRDSRLGDGSPVLEFTSSAWKAFTTGLKKEKEDDS